MSDLVMWTLIVGFLLPPLLAIVQQPSWSAPLRSIVMFVACIIAGIGTVYFTDDGSFTKERLISSFLLVMVTAISTYKGLWQTTTIAPKIEAATSPKPSDG